MKWSEKIKCRRLRWLGHLLRLDSDTPVRKCLDQALQPVKRPRGRPKQTWIKLVNEDLQSVNINLQIGQLELEELAQNRDEWREVVKKLEAQSQPMA